MEEVHEFKLSAKESEFLRRLAMDDKWLADVLESHVDATDGRAVIRLNAAEIEPLREYFTTKLAEVGFDENYSPNEEGTMFETLIDKLHIC
jgi:hypothetical protein